MRRFVTAGEEKPRFEVLPGAVEPPVLPDVSISHSGRFVIAAFCTTADVGVDVEERSVFSRIDDTVLEGFLTPAERRRLRTPREVADAFTAKEAVLKAVGWGLVIDPLDLELRGGRVERFDAVQRRPVSLSSLPVSAAVSAAVAVASDG